MDLPTDPISPRHLPIFRAVVTHYYLLLVSDWARITANTENVPRKHRSPPNIDNWDRQKLAIVLENFSNFMKTSRYLLTRDQVRERGKDGIEARDGKILELAGHLLENPSFLQNMVTRKLRTELKKVGLKVGG